jgi:hypothetical protein
MIFQPNLTSKEGHEQSNILKLNLYVTCEYISNKSQYDFLKNWYV